MVGGIALALAPWLYRENGGLIFKQQRHGRNVAPDEEPDLTVLKLKTLSGPGSNNISVTGCNHPDAGPISSIARVARVDEVLQLGQVLRGDMSAVGPRPVVPKERDDIFGSLSPEEQRQWIEARRNAPPGLAHQGAIDQYKPGYYNDPYRTAHTDIEYAETASLRGDLKLMARIAISLGNHGLQGAIQRLAAQAEVQLDEEYTEAMKVMESEASIPLIHSGQPLV